jgi:asparagine N-glycosylation enzyme membrane subunit Stt3
MKFGPFEGTPEEINNFFQNNGLNISDYIALPEEPIKAIWFAIPSTLILCTLAVLTLFRPSGASGVTFLFLIGCGGGLWLAVNTQLRFKNPWATGLIAICCLLLLLVALGVLTPIQMLEEVRSLKK